MSRSSRIRRVVFSAGVIVTLVPGVVLPQCPPPAALSPGADPISEGDHALTLNFFDGESGLPTAVRVAVFAPGDVPVAPEPLDAYAFQLLDSRSYFYCDASVTLSVPEGPITVHAGKGFEYEPVSLQLTVTSDEAVDITLQRFVDVKRLGWHSGDTHTHMAHQPINLVLTPAHMRLAAEAEDLSFLHIMDTEEDFTGAPHPLSRPDRILYWGQEYRNPHFSHTTLLGLRKWIRKTDSCPNWVACARVMNGTIAARAQWESGALVIATHPKPSTKFADVTQWPGGGWHRSLAFDLLAGHVDAIDLLCYSNLPPPEGNEDYTAALNAGFRMPASAGTDAVLSTGASFPPGGYRVYAYTPAATGGFSSHRWMSALRKGQTFVTNYPLIPHFSVEGRYPGDVLITMDEVARGAVYVTCVAPLDRVDIVADGEVVQTLHPPPGSDGRTIAGFFEVPTESTRWMVARAHGPAAGQWHAIGAGGLFAQTSPIYIEKHGRDPEAVVEKTRAGAAHFVRRLQDLNAWLGEVGDFTPESRAEFDAEMEEAMAYYTGLVPDPPDSFELRTPKFYSPGHGAIVVSVLTPRFVWAPATDPDPGDVISYNLAYGTRSDYGDAVQVNDLTLSAYQVPLDAPLENATTYYWKVVAVDQTGLTRTMESSFFVDLTVTGAGDVPPVRTWQLGRPAPNPFNPTVTIDYRVPAAGVRHSLVVVDVRGRRVRTLFDGVRPPGSYALRWDGFDDNGRRAASGVYFVRLESPGGVVTRKVTLIK